MALGSHAGPIGDAILPSACGLPRDSGACKALVCPCPAALASHHARPVFSGARVIRGAAAPPGLGGASGSVRLLNLATPVMSGPRFVSRLSSGLGTRVGIYSEELGRALDAMTCDELETEMMSAARGPEDADDSGEGDVSSVECDSS